LLVQVTVNAPLVRVTTIRVDINPQTKTRTRTRTGTRINVNAALNGAR